MKQLQAKILKNEEIAPGFFRMRIASSYLAKKARPGQFVEVRCGKETDPLLRRPLGIHRVVKDGIELLYEVVGRGTEIISGMKEKDACDLIGPLGNGFDIPPRPGASILIAGGNGVAPLLALAENLAYMGKTKIDVFIGACKKEHILCAEDFKKLGAKVYIATEDGSKGRKGFITSYLSDFLSAKRSKLNATIYACGPTGMLKAVSEIAWDNRLSCQVSLEERMACGVGVCLGCPVKVLAPQRVNGLASSPANPQTHSPVHYAYKMVCKDGPVFNAEEIAW